MRICKKDFCLLNLYVTPVQNSIHRICSYSRYTSFYPLSLSLSRHPSHELIPKGLPKRASLNDSLNDSLKQRDSEGRGFLLGPTSVEAEGGGPVLGLYALDLGGGLFFCDLLT